MVFRSIFAEGAGSESVFVETYSVTVGHYSKSALRKSHHNTIGTITETIDGDYLGDFRFQGVDTTPAFDFGARIYCVQDGASGTRVPANLFLNTYTSTGVNSNQLVLHHDGGVGVGTASPTRTYGADPFLEIEGASNPALIIHDTGQASDYGLVAAGDFIGFYFGNTRLIEFDNSGNVNIVSATSTITGGTDLFLEATTNLRSVTTMNATVANEGNVYIQPTGDARIYRSTSGLKYKDKIKDLELDSSLIYNIPPRSYNSKCTGDDKKRRFVGLIADEIEPFYPEIIDYGDDHKPENYDSRMLMTLMLAEEQKIRQELDILKEEVSELKKLK